MSKQTISRLEHLNEFEKAPLNARFGERAIAAVRDCSPGLLQQERIFGGGPQYQKVKGRVLYKKSDVLDWLNQYEFVSSTSQLGGA